MATYALTTTGVTRIEDGTSIPNDPDNTDWIEYQKWLSLGGVPRALQPGPQYDWNGSAWVVNPASQAQLDLAASLGVNLATVKANGPVMAFLAMSPADVTAYFNANVTGLNAPSLAAIKTALITYGQVLNVLAGERIRQG